MFVPTVQIQLGIKMLYSDFTVVRKNKKFKTKRKNYGYLMIVMQRLVLATNTNNKTVKRSKWGSIIVHYINNNLTVV